MCLLNPLIWEIFQCAIFVHLRNRMWFNSLVQYYDNLGEMPCSDPMQNRLFLDDHFWGGHPGIQVDRGGFGYLSICFSTDLLNEWTHSILWMDTFFSIWIIANLKVNKDTQSRHVYSWKEIPCFNLKASFGVSMIKSREHWFWTELSKKYYSIVFHAYMFCYDLLQRNPKYHMEFEHQPIERI